METKQSRLHNKQKQKMGIRPKRIQQKNLQMEKKKEITGSSPGSRPPHPP